MKNLLTLLFLLLFINQNISQTTSNVTVSGKTAEYLINTVFVSPQQKLIKFSFNKEDCWYWGDNRLIPRIFLIENDRISYTPRRSVNGVEQFDTLQIDIKRINRKEYILQFDTTETTFQSLFNAKAPPILADTLMALDKALKKEFILSQIVEIKAVDTEKILFRYDGKKENIFLDETTHNLNTPKKIKKVKRIIRNFVIANSQLRRIRTTYPLAFYVEFHRKEEFIATRCTKVDFQQLVKKARKICSEK